MKELGYALSFFDRWSTRGARSKEDVERALQQMQDNTQSQLDYLREQVEMRTRGLQWLQFACRWSSSKDEVIGTVPELQRQVEEILIEEQPCRRAGTLPSHAPAPTPRRKTFKELGTPTAQAETMREPRIELSPDQLCELTERERTRLDAAFEIDRVGDRQQEQVPNFDLLLNNKIEVRWRYWTMEGGKWKSQYIWCEGKVVEVADGKTTRKTPRCRSPLPWGSVRIQWPEGSEFNEEETYSWTILKAVDWNKESLPSRMVVRCV